MAGSSRDSTVGSRMSPQARKSKHTRWVTLNGDRNCHLYALHKTTSARRSSPPEYGSWVNAGPRAEQATHSLLLPDGQPASRSAAPAPAPASPPTHMSRNRRVHSRFNPQPDLPPLPTLLAYCHSTCLPHLENLEMNSLYFNSDASAC